MGRLAQADKRRGRVVAIAADGGLWALPEVERLPPWEWRQATRIHTDLSLTKSRCCCGALTETAMGRHLPDRFPVALP